MGKLNTLWLEQREKTKIISASTTKVDNHSLKAGEQTLIQSKTKYQRQKLLILSIIDNPPK